MYRTALAEKAHISETTVKEAMIPRTEIVAIPENISIDEMFKAFGESGYSRLPVYRGSLDDIVGVLQSKDPGHHLLQPDHVIRCL